MIVKLQFVYLQSNCNIREFVGFIGTIKPKLQARLSTDSQSSNVSVTSMLSTQTDRTHKTSPVLHKWNSEKGKQGTMLLLEIFAKYDLKSYLSFFVIEGRGLIITVLLLDPYFFYFVSFFFFFFMYCKNVIHFQIHIIFVYEAQFAQCVKISVIKFLMIW